MRPPCRAVIVGLVVTGTVVAGVASQSVQATSPPADLTASLTPAGQTLAEGTDWSTQPAYRLDARLDPTTGAVDGRVVAEVPVGAGADEARFRWFPAAAAKAASIGDVRVDDEVTAAVVDGSLLTMPLRPGHGERVEITIAFGFVAPEFVARPLDLATIGAALAPADIGLLARSDDALMLGHWFPVWIPDGLRIDQVLDGYGDIANYPAATMSARLDIPTSHTVVSSGVSLDAPAVVAGDDRRTVTEGGIGLRDFAVVVLAAAPEQRTFEGGDSQIIVSAPAGTAGIAEVGDVAITSLEMLGGSFGAYPWSELDVVAAPLGSGVGGMEWPGMVWIESTTFAGGIPGLADAGDLDAITELLESDPSVSSLLGIDDLGLQIETLREWTVAHEIGHMWWHSLVGNDSIDEPVIDEPLAQHSACLVERVRRTPDAAAVCDAHTTGQFEQLTALLGVQDTAADQPADEFDSSTQYGALVYGKAPIFYRGSRSRVRRRCHDGGARRNRQRSRLPTAHRRRAPCRPRTVARRPGPGRRAVELLDGGNQRRRRRSWMIAIVSEPEPVSRLGRRRRWLVRRPDRQ